MVGKFNKKMPHGKPRTNEERRRRHKRLYGNTNIPSKRRGKNRK
jgi:hypothetical protein